MIGLLLGVLALSELVALSGMSWKNLQRIDRLKQEIVQSHQLEQLLFILQDQTPSKPDKQKLLQAFLHNQPQIPDETRILLEQLQNILSHQAGRIDKNTILPVLHKTLSAQLKAEESLLDKIYANNELELKLAILVPTGVVLLFLLVGRFYFKRFVTEPINNLERLLTRLAEGSRQPVEPGKTDPAIKALFDSYNRLVNRLRELEQEHRQHTASLEQEVRQATHSLLEQSHSLARAERLAAVGELAASAAHELRNPLAGIQVALENMCQDCQDRDMCERLQLVHNEIKRLTGRLNDLLVYSRQQPEQPTHFILYDWIKDLITLLNYQIDEKIHIKLECDPDIDVFLPKNELRQALLNLILNAIQSIGSQAGTVTVRVNIENKQLIIDVLDTGAGFSDEFLQQGIRPFASHKKHGTGLGLPMVLRFARAHGGDLSVWNTEQGLACVRLTLSYLQ